MCPFVFLIFFSSIMESDGYVEVKKASICNVQILAVSDRGPLVHYNISASLWLNFTVDISTIPPVKWCSIRRHECIDKTDELELHDVYIISNYTISSVGNSNWGVYYIDICDERIMNYTVYLDSDNCTDYSIPNVTDIMPQKYVGLVGNNVTVDIHYKGNAASSLYILACNRSASNIVIYDPSQFPWYSLKVVSYNYICFTRGELKVIRPSLGMSDNYTCYVINEDGSETGKSGTSEMVFLDYPSAESVTSIVQKCTSDYFEWSWTIFAVCEYLDPIIYIDNKDISTYNGLHYTNHSNTDPNIKSHTIITLKVYNIKELGIGQHQINIQLKLKEDVNKVSTYNNNPNMTEPLIINVQDGIDIIIITIIIVPVSLVLLLIPIIVCVIWYKRQARRGNHDEREPLLPPAPAPLCVPVLDEHAHDGDLMTQIQQQQFSPSSDESSESSETSQSEPSSPGQQSSSSNQLNSAMPSEPLPLDQIQSPAAPLVEQPSTVPQPQSCDVSSPPPSQPPPPPLSPPLPPLQPPLPSQPPPPFVPQQTNNCVGSYGTMVAPLQESTAENTESQQAEMTDHQTLVADFARVPGCPILLPSTRSSVVPSVVTTHSAPQLRVPPHISGSSVESVSQHDHHLSPYEVSTQEIPIVSKIFVLYHCVTSSMQADPHFKQSIDFMVTLLKNMFRTYTIKCDLTMADECDNVSDFSDWAVRQIQHADYVIIICTPEICECFCSSAQIQMSKGVIDSSSILEYCQEKSLLVSLNTSPALIPPQCPLQSRHCYTIGIDGLRQRVQLQLRLPENTLSRREIITQYMDEHCNDSVVKELRLFLERLQQI